MWKRKLDHALEARYLPPGCMKDYFEQFKSVDVLNKTSFSTFWRVWRIEFDHLRFRAVELTRPVLDMLAPPSFAEGTVRVPFCPATAGPALPRSFNEPIPRPASLLGVEIQLKTPHSWADHNYPRWNGPVQICIPSQSSL